MHQRKRNPRFLVWYRLLRIAKRGVGYISPSFIDAGLTRPQFDLLGAIAMDEGQTQQVYAERMTVTKGNITQLLDRLQKSGLVLRCKEGRTNCLYLTESGWAMISRITPEHDARLFKMFATLTPDEVAQLTKILRKLEQNIE
ncbi:MAG: MarR family transcriptional regulator [Chloroflexota bacterium]